MLRQSIHDDRQYLRRLGRHRSVDDPGDDRPPLWTMIPDRGYDDRWIEGGELLPGFSMPVSEIFDDPLAE